MSTSIFISKAQDRNQIIQSESENQQFCCARFKQMQIHVPGKVSPLLPSHWHQELHCSTARQIYRQIEANLEDVLSQMRSLMWVQWQHEHGQEPRAAVRAWLKTRELHRRHFSISNLQNWADPHSSKSWALAFHPAAGSLTDVPAFTTAYTLYSVEPEHKCMCKLSSTRDFKKYLKF